MQEEATSLSIFTVVWLIGALLIRAVTFIVSVVVNLLGFVVVANLINNIGPILSAVWIVVMLFILFVIYPARQRRRVRKSKHRVEV